MNDHLHALPPGHELGEYRIERVIGSGGFGITYYARDIHLDKPVAIKEYLPNELALRTDTTTVRAKSSADEETYQWGLERFLDEARALARFDHPHLNGVYRFFEDNGTAYMVLEYIEGETLSAILEQEGQLAPERLRRLLDELLSGIEEVHKAGYVHRDIKPGNIMLRENGSAVLLDFGSARQAISQRSKNITSILTPGYAPFEQYSQRADNTGPWSDLYSLGIVAYRCISGIGENKLLDATERFGIMHRGEQDQDMPAAVEVGKGRYDESLLAAIDWSIQVNEKDRPQDVAALRSALGDESTSPPVDAPPPPATLSPANTLLPASPAASSWANPSPQTTASSTSSLGRIVLVTLFAILVILAIDYEFGLVPKAKMEWEPIGKLLGRDYSPTAQDENGWRDLHYAAVLNLPALAGRLLELQALVNAPLKNDGKEWSFRLKQKLQILGVNFGSGWNRGKQTPLYLAVAWNNLEMVTLLLDRGANIWARDIYGNTPLHSAAWNNHYAVADLLIENGSHIGANSNNGNTPLHSAAWTDSSDVAALLIHNGANIRARNNNGETPLDVARREDSNKIIRLLQYR